MPDYKEMYFKMFRTVEKAIEMLIVVQRECEDIYIISSDLKIKGNRYQR